MSIKVCKNYEIPEKTVKIAKAAFPKGTAYMTFRDSIGFLFDDNNFKELFSRTGRPALSPWRLALITIMQFRENLSDREAAEAVRARIDWKYILSLEIDDPGFDASVLSEFRTRLLHNNKYEHLLNRLLDELKEKKLIKDKGKQRTDATHIHAAVRELNRLELIGETMRAALNEIASQYPHWLKSFAPVDWYTIYGHRIEDSRLPCKKDERQNYAEKVGKGALLLLQKINESKDSIKQSNFRQIDYLRKVMDRHFNITKNNGIRLKDAKELKKSKELIESPYDVEARYRKKEVGEWTGYIVHFSETCEDEYANIITNVLTTEANVHEALCVEKIHDSLIKKDLKPDFHLVDSAYISSHLIIDSINGKQIQLIGPPRLNPSWQNMEKNGFEQSNFKINWEEKTAICPNNKKSKSWCIAKEKDGRVRIKIGFSFRDCKECPDLPRCTNSKCRARQMCVQPQQDYEAIKIARAFIDTKEGKLLYKKRAGIEGTISQAVRLCDVRHARYIGKSKTHLQNIATAAAINIDRIVSWIEKKPKAITRKSSFEKLAA